MNSAYRFLTAAAVLISLCPWPVHAQAPATSTQNLDTPTPSEVPTPNTQPEETSPEKPRKRRFQLGPKLGLFRLSNARSRNRFGGTDSSIGIGLTPIRQPSTKGELGLDFKLFYLKQNTNRAIWAPIGVGYRKGFSASETATLRPYIGASLNIVPANIKVLADGINTRLKMGLGSSAFAGIVFRDKLSLEARYIAITKISGFDLSGASLSASIRF
ncbi:MAG: hypothetical protein JWR45_3838 [Blastococcus sp.]|nr:hypothetical protein [Blastococcus sp.]